MLPRSRDDCDIVLVNRPTRDVFATVRGISIPSELPRSNLSSAIHLCPPRSASCHERALLDDADAISPRETFVPNRMERISGRYEDSATSLRIRLDSPTTTLQFKKNSNMQVFLRIFFLCFVLCHCADDFVCTKSPPMVTRTIRSEIDDYLSRRPSPSGCSTRLAKARRWLEWWFLPPAHT